MIKWKSNCRLCYHYSVCKHTIQGKASIQGKAISFGLHWPPTNAFQVSSWSLIIWVITKGVYPAIVIEGFILFACLFFVGLIFEENILKLQVHNDEEPRLPCLLVFKVWGRSFPKTKQLRKHNFVSERPLSLTQLWICSFGVKRYLLHTFSFVSSLIIIIIIIITMHL